MTSCTASRELLAAAEKADLAWLETQIARLSPDDPAFIVYTSGTTGHPKGALVTHGKHLAATDTVVAQYPTLREKPHRTVVYLPLCHVLGRDVAITLPLMSQLVPHFGEDPEDFAATLFEVAPTVMFTVPRYLQKFASHVLVGVLNSSRLKRAPTISRCASRAIMSGAAGTATTIRPAGSRSTAFCARCVFRPILNKLGFDQLELVVSGGAALPAETMALWHMYGVNVVEMYGQTEEAGGIIAGQRGPFPRPGDVGTPVEGVEVTLADDGEVLVRSPDLFDGYWRNDEATREVKGADGWLRTGDVGEWRDGALRLVDRARDFSSPPAARPSRRPSSRTRCARALMSRKRSCSATAANISPPSSRSTSTPSPTGRAPTMSPTPASPASPRIRASNGSCESEIDKRQRRPCARRADQVVPHPAQGARSGRRRRAGDADAQGQAQADVRALQGAGRGHVRRQRRAADRRRQPAMLEALEEVHNDMTTGGTTMFKKTLLGAIAVCARCALPAAAQDAYVVGVTAR